MQTPASPQPVWDEPVTLARACGAHGEVVLRRRGSGADAVHELIVNGAFAMDSTETASERELARLAYAHGPPGGGMLIGGLGLGYTAQAALLAGAAAIDVVELEPALVQWAGEGATPTLARLAADPRVALYVADIAAVLTGTLGTPRKTWDAIVLDVDNGPDFLIHPENAPLYSVDLLAAAYHRLTVGGRLAVWCQGPSPMLLTRLQAIAPTAQQHLCHVTRGQRRFCYAIYTLDRQPS